MKELQVGSVQSVGFSNLVLICTIIVNGVGSWIGRVYPNLGAVQCNVGPWWSNKVKVAVEATSQVVVDACCIEKEFLAE